ncbi:MAG: UvrD-helicase domain-containing protein [Candidatus Hermodarchaeota archaeon]
MPKGKIRQTLQEKLENKIQIEKEWQKFLKKDTYLIFDEKSKIFDSIEQLVKIPRISWFYFKTRKKLKIIKKELKALKDLISNYNKIFVERRLDQYSSFFDGKDDNLKFPLDTDQRLAIIKDDKYNLVVAGAGAGKTSLLTARIAYLIRRNDSVDPERILALAFIRNAADEMEKRIRKNYNLNVRISTFHSLGWTILNEETGKRPNLLFDGNENDQYLLITDLFKNLLREKQYQDNLIEYLAYHPEQEVKEESFEYKEEYYRYMRNKKYTTLNNIEVKSVGERDIANFLFLHNIEFKYEPLVNWADKSEEDKEYHPDFYLPDFDIYIEHWGLNEKCEVAPWFTISTQEYLEVRKWKLEQFEKHQKVLVETWDYNRNQGILISNLQNNLKEKYPGIEFKTIPYEELIEKVFNFKEQRNEVSKLIVSFIRIAKANYLKPKRIEKRIKSGNYTRKQLVFGKLALEVYKRYQDFLKREDKIDFNDMINLAVKLVKANREKYRNKYDHILIDEFQDISHQRMKLIQRFVNENSHTKLFCVGDDCQSIFQFTGSDVRFFVNFEDYFPNPEITILNKNYRSSKEIVDMANDLIYNNKKQIKKRIYSIKGRAQQPIFIELNEKLKYSFQSQITNYYNLIEILISNGVKPSEIMVLSRFNRALRDLEQYCGANEIPTEFKAGGIRFHSAHGSKGLESKHVIIMNANSGLYGFPCEIQDSSVMEMAKRFVTENFFEEERRLFYVALTRSKKFLYVYSLENQNSMFLNEINPYLMNIYIDTGERWHQGLSEFFSNYIKGISLEVPIICPRCGRFLVEKQGKYGRFLGCAGFSSIDCRYTYNLESRTEYQEEFLIKPKISQIKQERSNILNDDRFSHLFVDEGLPLEKQDKQTLQKGFIQTKMQKSKPILKPRFNPLNIDNASSKKEHVEYTTRFRKGVIIENLIFDFETEKAVKFRRNKDTKILWVPKAVLKKEFIRDRKTPQNIQLKFKPRNLSWK